MMNIRKLIHEELSKADKDYIDQTIKKAIKADLSDAEINKRVEKAIKPILKNSDELEDKTVGIIKNVITQLFKSLYQKRQLIIPGLTNKRD